jgi:hypothetical protein
MRFLGKNFFPLFLSFIDCHHLGTISLKREREKGNSEQKLLKAIKREAFLPSLMFSRITFLFLELKSEIVLCEGRKEEQWVSILFKRNNCEVHLSD